MKLWHRVLITYIPFIIFFLFDFYSKSWAIGLEQSYNFGFLKISYHENHGVMLGAFSELPLVLKAVFLSTIGISIVCGFPLLIYVLELESKMAIVGLSLLSSGILGNVVDRIIYGYVVDFFYFDFTGKLTPVFNLADITQWLAYIFLSFGVYRELNRQILDNERRDKKWINNRFQLRFNLTLAGLVTFLGFVSFACTYTFFKFTIIELAPELTDKLMGPLTAFAITFACLNSLFLIVVTLVGKVISHRIAGPIYAMGRYLKDTIAGKVYHFKLRQSDYFTELEEPFNQINKEMTRLRSEANKPPAFDQSLYQDEFKKKSA